MSFKLLSASVGVQLVHQIDRIETSVDLGLIGIVHIMLQAVLFMVANEHMLVTDNDQLLI